MPTMATARGDASDVRSGLDVRVEDTRRPTICGNSRQTHSLHTETLMECWTFLRIMPGLSREGRGHSLQRSHPEARQEWPRDDVVQGRQAAERDEHEPRGEHGGE